MRLRDKAYWAWLLALLSIAACAAESDTAVLETPEYRILKVKPHLPQAFTQGLLMDGQSFLESSGLYGQSYVVRYDRSNTETIRKNLPKQWFAEGLASNGEHLILLSWQQGKALKLQQQTLETLGDYHYRGQGWGLTHDGQHWLMSNGSSTITRRDNTSFDELGRISVKFKDKPVLKLNELEFAGGFLWANAWQTPFVYAINPRSGEIAHRFDLTELVEKNTQNPRHESLNGIAYDAKHAAFWITGKHWPNRYLVHFNQDLLGNASEEKSPPR